jgi:hypothetical protein
MSQFRGDQANDTTVSSSVKTFTVSSGEEWAINSIQIVYTTNATAGSRQLVIQKLASDNTVLGQAVAGLTQAASNTYTYMFSLGMPIDTSLYSTTLSCSLPYWSLTAGQKLKIYDSAAIAPAGSGENMLVYIDRYKRKF